MVGRRTRVAAVAVLGLGAGACSGDEGTAVLTRAQIEERSGLELPASTDAFRATRTSSTELQLTATVTDADGRALADELGLESGRRVVTHASPLWELNPLGTISGGTSSDGDVRRSVELVDDAGDRSTLRVVLDGI